MRICLTNRVFVVTGLALSAAMLSGCTGTPEPEIGAAANVTEAALGQQDYSATIDENYRLRSSDALSITVFREPGLSLERVAISAEGNVSVPLAGSFRAAGLTLTELEFDIEQALDNAGLKRPDVSVNVVEYASHLVTVEGGVKSPGVYAFQPGARLSTAITLASGPNRVAKLGQVAVFREAEGGTAVAKFDYREIRRGTMIDPVLQPGDRVVVGISGLSQFWQDFLRALPAFGIFTNINY